MTDRLSHLDEQGRARMVDVSGKPDTRRLAVAEGRVLMSPETVRLVRESGIGKGDVLTVAKIAGVLAAKRTAELIPLCHPLLLMDVQVELELQPHGIDLRASVATVGKTGAEMEALTAVTLAGLTIYDMCKAVDKGMVLEAVRLVHKEGGKSDWSADRSATRATDE